ncbi:hypothetical protein KU6B_41310 [Mameliella alba]|nr:hypothetical protein KU6B_41310 [Mameliella alba]
MSNNKKNDDLDYETTGHEWDGIQEYNKPLPKWWLWTFYACIVWAIGYTIAYPAWPGISGATPGLLGFSTRGNVEKAITDHEAELGPINDKLASVELTAIADDQELLQYANNAGGAVFRTWCAQCHGSGAAGAKGYPNLLDDDWLWGGSIEAIHETVSHGIRNEVDDMARWSQMPAFGRDELLVEEEVVQVVNYVMQLSGQEPRDPAAAEAGAEVYDINCSGCHMEDGTGDRFQGAPNLTDRIWLYGGDFDSLYQTVYNSRFGVMPPMGGADLTEAEIRAVSVYVHGLGGGKPRKSNRPHKVKQSDPLAERRGIFSCTGSGYSALAACRKNIVGHQKNRAEARRFDASQGCRATACYCRVKVVGNTNPTQSSRPERSGMALVSCPVRAFPGTPAPFSFPSPTIHRQGSRRRSTIRARCAASGRQCDHPPKVRAIDDRVNHRARSGVRRDCETACPRQASPAWAGLGRCGAVPAARSGWR